MERSGTPPTRRTAGGRLLVAVAAGVVTAAVLLVAAPHPSLAPVVGWLVTAALYLSVTFARVGRMDAATTRSHATREDTTRRTSRLLVVVASVGSLAGVGYLLSDSSYQGADAVVVAALGTASVASSWFVVHTTYMLRYAELYYTEPVGGVAFNSDEAPRYADFAYLAFTLGMTYQVSDTAISSSALRAAVLRQSLLSYLLGAVVVAAAVNLVVGLGSSPNG